jgi:hypothetical protein
MYQTALHSKQRSKAKVKILIQKIEEEIITDRSVNPHCATMPEGSGFDSRRGHWDFLFT